MSGSLKYACTALTGTQKKGELKPDADGYYYLCIGALDFYNSAGIWYDWERSKHLFDASGTFQRRINNGCVYAEKDHPEWKEGMSFDAYVRRIKKIDPNRTCAHIREIELKQETVDGKSAVVIYGWVRPDVESEFGRQLKAALDNPAQNVCFSIRSLCEDEFVNGKIIRTLTEVVNFDWVIEPGIKLATKWRSPALESEVDIPIEVIRMAVAHNERMSRIGTESADDYEDLRNYIKRHDAPKQQGLKRPAGLSW